MTITSSEQPYDMGSWVAEKSGAVLERACELVDWLQEADADLPPQDRERIAAVVYALIYDAAKLTAFGHENLRAWSPERVERLCKQGSQGLQEFQKHVRGQASHSQAGGSAPVDESNHSNNGAHPKR